MDVLGRLKQVDELKWDQTVYATTSYNYNARDQITTSSQSGQIRTFNYDGYGRLSSKITPEQGTMNYSYFADDAVQTVTDARGASTTFAHNSRHLVTGITFGVPGGVAATPNLSFAYDDAGNRTSMTETSRSSEEAFQPKKYTSYERDAERQRRCNASPLQPLSITLRSLDPYDGSYITDSTCKIGV